MGTIQSKWRRSQLGNGPLILWTKPIERFIMKKTLRPRIFTPRRITIIPLTCVNCEFRFAGVGAGQVLGSAGVHAGVLGPGVEDNQGILGVVVHECEVVALGETHRALQQTNRRWLLRWRSCVRLICTFSHRISGSGFPSTTTARRDVSPMCTSTSSMMVSNLGGPADE